VKLLPTSGVQCRGQKIGDVSDDSSPDCAKWLRCEEVARFASPLYKAADAQD
jgi:hypothetical protein